ncbi:MAG: sulfur oxidation c-type cytochrome SoxX [Methylococcales bacterium]|nr:sulfur oxidation c-type cytochrome SoxX [Methylococcales bacterium]MBT7410655.1 sulfur oxidation c-type cytochrome SoxX [Methylococcales bacterium]
MITTIGIVNMLAMPLISHADGHSASIQPGMKIAFDKKKGNCLACHKIEGGVTLADIGPELNNMKQRFPDKSLIRKRIWDETKFNAETAMPPFGRHKILTESEIDKVVEFVWSL